MRINYDEPIENFPDAYEKSKDSNNYKLLQINAEIAGSLHNDLMHIFASTDINNASGKVLDHLYGGRLNLKRGGTVSDFQYKVLLTGKIMQNTTDGTHPKLLEALSYILQCDKSDIHIIGSKTSNSIIIKDIPLKVLTQAEFTPEQTIEMINKMLPVNVTIDEYGFTGTFEFGSGEREYNIGKGFSDGSDAVGGYLGLYGG